MNVRDIATQPIFVLSLALCALVATAGITLLLKKIFRKENAYQIMLSTLRVVL